jgi:transcription elongation factor Elf1
MGKGGQSASLTPVTRLSHRNKKYQRRFLCLACAEILIVASAVPLKVIIAAKLAEHGKMTEVAKILKPVRRG